MVERLPSYPVSVTDEYLAAILVELREVRAALTRLATRLNMPDAVLDDKAPEARRRRKAPGG